MRKIFFVAIFLVATSSSFAQIPMEVLVGNRQVHYINYWQKDLDTAGRFNFFSLNRFLVDYKDSTLNNISFDGQFSYQLQDWIGISAGGSYTEGFFVPSLGLSLGYANRKETFLIETYPTFLLFKQKVYFSMLGLMVYKPQFNKKWGLFSQLIFEPSSQLLRVGINYKQKIQFGVGADFFRLEEPTSNVQNIGLFLRYEIE